MLPECWDKHKSKFKLAFKKLTNRFCFSPMLTTGCVPAPREQTPQWGGPGSFEQIHNHQHRPPRAMQRNRGRAQKKPQHTTLPWTVRGISEQRGKSEELNCSIHVKIPSAGLADPSPIYRTHRRAGEMRALLLPIRIWLSAQHPVWSHLTTNKLLFQMCHFTFPWRALMYLNNIWGFRLGVGLFQKTKT